ncbi:hypothetical protein DID76_02345 [Candidatus Marinamargulisbacteria bacterium SCGC AG-414-C22]|nr:hypothetical protein DID76_02345 [Candidatus Marinamargulisbacteria bacterium SCGC AG-414-C22]
MITNTISLNNTSKTILDTSKNPVYWNQIDEETMQELIDNLSDKPWKEVISNYPIKKHIDYIAREDRADYVELLSLPKDAVVLDAACGWGAILMGLAKKGYKKVVGIDSNIYTLQFIQERAKQENISNIQLVRTDPFGESRLPFEDNTFDFINMNGILEWIGSQNDIKSPYDIQLSALKEFYRILKPNGYLALGIESRYGQAYWLGREDHSDLKFTNLMPRFMANIVMKILKGTPYRTWTYSHKGLKSILIAAGFKIESTYYPSPSYRFCDTLVPLDSWAVFIDYISRYGSKKKKIGFPIFKLFGLWRDMCDDFLFFVKK